MKRISTTKLLLSLLFISMTALAIAQPAGNDSLVRLNAVAEEIIYAEDLMLSSALDPMEALYGKAAGLWVKQNTGSPGDKTPSLYIRGRSTWRSASPLVLVDGVSRMLSSLSKDEIESIKVLKDAAATAIYGMRGANGVILVTTKRGSSDGFKVNVSYDKGINQAFRLPEFLGAYDYANAVNEASILDGDPAVYSALELNDYKAGSQPDFYPNSNWVDEALKDFGSTSNFNASFSGGGENATYFVLLNYQDEKGLFDNTDLDERYNSELKYEKFNLRINTDINLTSSTLFRMDIAGNIRDYYGPNKGVNAIMNAIYTVPSGVFPVKTSNDIWGGTEHYDNNPVAMIAGTGMSMVHTTELNLNTSLFQNLDKFVEGLAAELSIAYDNFPTYNHKKAKDFMYESSSFTRDPSTGEISDVTYVQYGSETDINITDGLGWQRRSSALSGRLKYDRELGNGMLNSSLNYRQEMLIYTGQNHTFRYQDFSALASYSQAGKYFIDLSLTYGGNSLLPEGARYGVFPAVAAAWLLSKESFMDDSNIFSDLKLRASWGLSGNGGVYLYLDDQPYNSGGAYYFTDNVSSSSGIREGRLASPGIVHEKVSGMNLGTDMRLWNSLDLSLDLFYERHYDILTETGNVTSEVLGVAEPYSNEGEVINRGLDLSLGWDLSRGDLQYHAGANFSFARNKVINMNEAIKSYDYLKATGLPVGQQFGLESDGFFSDQEDIDNSELHTFYPVRPGDIKYIDQNSDGIINQEDVVPMGYVSAIPEIYYSFNFGLKYKGFGLDAQFQGMARQTKYLNKDGLFWPLRNQSGISSISSERWTPGTAETATLPRFSMKDNSNNYRKNDIWLADASFLKLRYLDFYYDLPSVLTGRMKMSSAKVYLRGMNLFSIDGIKVLDPEATGAVYPALRSYHVGIKIAF